MAAQVQFVIEPVENLEGLRACMNCRITRTFEQFVNAGCPNCEKFMKFMHSPDRTNSCTTAGIVGLVSIPEGCKNWCTRIRPVENFAAGMYAFCVLGAVPSRYMCELLNEDNNAANGGPSL